MIFKSAIVKWIDSTYYRTDTSFDETPEKIKPRTLYSFGLLLYEDQDCVVICQDSVSSKDTNFSRLVLSIPNISILDKKIIEIEFD